MVKTSITLAEYFGSYNGHSDITPEIRAHAAVLLTRVNALLEVARTAGVLLEINPATGSLISGSTNGGYRPRRCPVGARYSSHKEGMGVDVYDPHNGDLENWITDEILEEFGLYREHPSQTKEWVHFTTREPGSKRRTFYA